MRKDGETIVALVEALDMYDIHIGKARRHLEHITEMLMRLSAEHAIQKKAAEAHGELRDFDDEYESFFDNLKDKYRRVLDNIE